MGDVNIEKLKKVRDESQVIGEFLDYFLNFKEVVFATWHGDRLVCIQESINQILADYFNIDLRKLEEEKRKIFLELQMRNVKDLKP